MGYIGQKPAESFTSFATQTFSTSATSSYTLDHAVTNENELALFINNVRQQPGSGNAYTATGTALTLSANTASTDTMYAVFLGRALQTVNPPAASVGASQVADDLISGKTALAATPADTDELLISDAGTLKRIDYSYIKSDPTHVLLSTTNVTSAASEVDITSNINSTYNRYMINIINLRPATNASHLRMRFFQGGSVDTGGYDSTSAYNGSDDGSGPTINREDNSDYMTLADEVGSDATEPLNGTIYLHDPSNSTTHTRLTGFASWSRGDNVTTALIGGRIGQDVAVDGVRFYMSSGNITSCIIKLYGIA
tara:strand:- start:2098 stop:3030 length:933 start_codon:yes stop_codon:yes gene_type:complete